MTKNLFGQLVGTFGQSPYYNILHHRFVYIPPIPSFTHTVLEKKVLENLRKVSWFKL